MSENVSLWRWGSEGNYVFLIDEAHNLLERGREMYSAPLRKEDLLELKREIKQTITSEMEEAAQKKRDKDGISGQMHIRNDRYVKTTATGDYPGGKQPYRHSLVCKKGLGSTQRYSFRQTFSLCVPLHRGNRYRLFPPG